MRGLTVLILAICLLFPFVCAGGAAPPKVIETFPRDGAKNVDPATPEIWVKFNRTMTDHSWSWCYEDPSQFPQVGAPRYTEDLTKCVLPVRLEAGKTYVIWINTQNSQNFKDRAGVPAAPCKFTFKTK